MTVSVSKAKVIIILTVIELELCRRSVMLKAWTLILRRQRPFSLWLWDGWRVLTQDIRLRALNIRLINGAG